MNEMHWDEKAAQADVSAAPYEAVVGSFGTRVVIEDANANILDETQCAAALNRLVAAILWGARERDALRARVAELEAAARWIPVSERLPGRNTFCLAVFDGEVGELHYGPAPMADGFYFKSSLTSGLCKMTGVTHWQPLPAPPETEKEKS